MTKVGWVIATLSAAVLALVAALMFVLGRLTAPTHFAGASLNNMASANRSAVAQPATPVERSVESVARPRASDTPDNSSLAEGAATGAPFTETLPDLEATLKFVPTARFRRLIEYRVAAISPTDDSSCSQPYSARERVTRINFAWGFVIDRFWTWNSEEGQQEYIVDEPGFPHALQGSVHDLVKQNQTLTITKQRCGQGQVASLVAIRP